MPHTHRPITEEYKEKMNAVAKGLDDIFNGGITPKNNGWCLLVFPFGNPNNQSRINYISNSNREDMIVAMKEFIARAEGRHHEHKVKQ